VGLLLQNVLHPQAVVESNASSNSSCVVLIVLLFVSKNKRAIKTKLLELKIFTSTQKSSF
jgi:hypothetical protein